MEKKFSQNGRMAGGGGASPPLNTLMRSGGQWSSPNKGHGIHGVLEKAVISPGVQGNVMYKQLLSPLWPRCAV